MHIWELFPRVLVLNARGHDDIIARFPVDGCVDTVLVRGEQRIYDAEQLGRAPTCGGRVGLNKADDLVGVDDEDGADSIGDTSSVDVGCVLVIEPIYQVRPCQGLIFPPNMD